MGRRAYALVVAALLGLLALGAAVTAPHISATVIAEILKIDSTAADGLGGVEDSLSYRIGEIERHLHNRERWVGAAAVPTATSRWAVDSMTPWTLTAGNDDWGPWVQIKGSDDNLGIAGQVRADIHRIVISDVSSGGDKEIHRFQVSNGATGDAGIAAGTYTETMFVPLKGGKQVPLDVMANRGALTSTVWARVWVSGQNATTMDFFLGVHGYEG